MPKRNDLKKILLIGAGPIIIGQACEFDYSGTQACKALKEEGYHVILVNSNPATIMTDPDLADATYIEPINYKTITKIIEREKPNALLPTMGGQTALNCTLELEKKGILKKFNIELIGANIKSIKKAEDRNLFKKSIEKIGLKTSKCKTAHNIEKAYEVIKEIGFPCIIRPSFTMGGSGGGIAYNYEEFNNICKNGFELSPTNELLIDESLIGWKEYEMEVVRDKKNNCIIVCSIENFDPMGIHTGDSITVAPAQTLSDKEFQKMRNASIKILEEIGVETGGANVQFAINPKNGNMIVVEMNPRVSRSSALASKATGFPIARIATKLAIGYTLDELKNNITNNVTPASFEPSLDYIVTKIPRFNFEKFFGCNDRLTTQMKSVGEVMGIGSTFQESLQKSMRSLENNSYGFDLLNNSKKSKKIIKNKNKLRYELKEAGPNRLWFIGEAFRIGWTCQKISKITYIDPWFLYQIQEIIQLEENIKKKNIKEITKHEWNIIKKKGFSDIRIAQLLSTTPEKIYEERKKIKLYPVYKRIDTCAAEFPTKTAYMYSTWEQECESKPTKNKKKIIIIGSGPNRIGQGIEFDYCCVHAAQELKKENYETIMINCNPETVSTDYDISDRLYFEPITLEDILSIVRIEKPLGVIIQYGGQTPLKLSKYFKKYNIPVIGTQPQDIDKAENRSIFKKIVTELKLKQPKNEIATSLESAISKTQKIGYPVIVRPSYVLGGRDMEIIYDEKHLKKYFQKFIKQEKLKNILIDQYLENATEIDVDAICDGKTVFIGGILEHIEQAGIHSGDSSCSLPTYTITQKIKKKIRIQVKKLALKLFVQGLLNIQFAVKQDKIYILEVNTRASRTIPFVSKAIGIPLAKIAIQIMCGKNLTKLNYIKEKKIKYFSVKEAILPFNKFPGINPILGPEMRSTGEVMGIGNTFHQAFYKAIFSTTKEIKKFGRVLLSVKNKDKPRVANLAVQIKKIGYTIDATQGTHNFLKNIGISSRLVNKVHEGRPNIQDLIKNKEYVYILNTTSSFQSVEEAINICEEAIKYKIYYDTTINGAFATIMSLKNYNDTNKIYSLQEIKKV